MNVRKIGFSLTLPILSLLLIMTPFWGVAGGVIEAQQQSKPNIIQILIDDASTDILRPEIISQHYPNIQQHLVDAGTTFNNFQTNTPLCGPIRASLFRGQYAHNTEIKTNYLAPESAPEGTPSGSWTEFYNRDYVSDEVGVWMQDEGYKTMLVGKYHHANFPTAAPEGISYIAPGWDEFYVSQGAAYFRVNRLINGVKETTALWPNEYRTDVEKDDILTLLDEHEQSNDNQPFFLYFAPFSPHLQPNSADPMYAPRHAGLFADNQVPRDPSFDEQDISDKATHFQAGFPELSEGRIEAIDRVHRDRLRSLKTVDEAIGEIVSQLQATGELENTVISLASDNGYALGHHRIPSSKKLPYDVTYNVPMYVRGPGIPAGRELEHLVNVTDFAPTYLDLAGGSVPSFVDGKSIVPLLKQNVVSPAQWRSGVVIENWEPAGEVNASYKAVRMQQSSYIEWESGEKEYYDHATDPYEIENRYNDLTVSEKASLSSFLALYGDCVGAACNIVHPSPVINSLSTVPETTISLIPSTSQPGPTPNENIEVLPYDIHGSASSPLGIDRILILIKDRVSDLYWDGSQWTSEYTRQEAQITTNTSGFANWTTQLPAGLGGSGNLLITARAFNVINEFDQSPARVRVTYTEGGVDESQTSYQGISFSEGTEKPIPTSILQQPISINGLSTASGGVQRVQIAVRDLLTKDFWNGSAWQAGYAQVFITDVDSPGATSSTWSYTLPEPVSTTDKLLIQSRTRSLSGQLDPSAAKAVIKIAPTEN